MTDNKGWRTERLDQIVSLQRGHDLTWRDRRPGSVPVMGSAGANGTHDRAIAPGPGVVLGRSGASYGQAHYVESDYWPHNTALYITDFHGNNPRYIYNLLDFIDFSRYNSGGAQQSLNRNFIAGIVLDIPDDAEQERITAAIDDADALITSLEGLIAKKRDIKQGMMQELLTGRTRLGGFSSDWPSVGILDLVTIVSGQVDPRLPSFRDLPLIAPDHIESGTGRLIALKTAAEQSAISGKYLVEPGDVIYSKIRPYLRKVHLATFRALCSADMYPLRPESGVNPEFILNTLLAETFTEFAISASMRSGIPKINRTEFAEFELQAPPAREQRAIGDALSNMDDLIDSLERLIAKKRDIKQGMMQELLTGHTRLPVEAAV